MTELYNNQDLFIKAPPEPYRLPYDNAAAQPFVDMANSALLQVRTAEENCRRLLEASEEAPGEEAPGEEATTAAAPADEPLTEDETAAEAAPEETPADEAPPQPDSPASGLLFSAKALLLSAQSCSQAQGSLCQALALAEENAQTQVTALKMRLEEVEQELKALNDQASSLRANVTMITDNPAVNDAYATTEAKRLLDVLEAAYQKHAQRKALLQSNRELLTDLKYLKESAAEARKYTAETDKLKQQAADEWQKLTDLLDPNAETEGDGLPQSRLVAAYAAAQQAAAERAAEAELAWSPEEEAEDRPSAWSTIWTCTKLILLAFLIAMVLRAYCIDVTVVEGLSMSPTLNDGDYLISSKISFLLDRPDRGDIVVLDAPDVPGDDYIKRVIAKPNDELRIADGRVYLNGKQLTENYLPPDLLTDGDIDIVIPKGYYFVMGDNREDSRDSREEDVGLISRDAIQSKAVLRLYPFDSFGTLK